MGHVFVAMDAVNRPGRTSTLIPGTPTVDSNIDNATWVGDLGGILRSLIYFEADSGREASVLDVQRIFPDEAEPQDLLGNIDGLLIAQRYSIRMNSQNNGSLVSDIIREYYRTISPAISKQAKLQAYASIIGLGELDRQTNMFKGGEHFFNRGNWFSGLKQFTSEEEWINYYAPQVAQSAAQFILGDAFKSSLNLPKIAIKTAKGEALTDEEITDPDRLRLAIKHANRAAKNVDSAKVILRTFLRGIKDGIRN
jgi:hypothetical protein